MKYLILFFALALLLIGACTPHLDVKCFVGIDVSLSAKNELAKNIEWLKQKAHSGQEIVIFVFADQCYESFAGSRPSKDRDIDDLVTKACASAKNTKWDTGTKFENIVTFLSNRVNKQSAGQESRVFIYTDGYFEDSKFTREAAKSALDQLSKNGLNQITFVGVHIEAKEKIYNWFRDSNIKVNFAE